MPKKFAVTPEQAYEEYKLMGSVRSVDKLLTFYKKKLGSKCPSKGTFAKWSRENNWQDRVKLFDRMTAEEVEKHELQRMEEMKTYDLKGKSKIIAALAFEQMTDYLAGRERSVITNARELRNVASTAIEMIRISKDMEGSVQDKEVEEAATTAEERERRADEEAKRLLSHLTAPGMGGVQ